MTLIPSLERHRDRQISVRSRPAWYTKQIQRQLGLLYKEILLQKQADRQTNRKTKQIKMLFAVFPDVSVFKLFDQFLGNKPQNRKKNLL